MSGSGWNHSFGSFQNSDQVGRGEGAEVVLSLFVKGHKEGKISLEIDTNGEILLGPLKKITF